MKTYNFDIDIRVHDPDALFTKALASAALDGIDLNDALFQLSPHGVIDVLACLVQILDPGHLVGCDILGSTAICVHCPFPPEN